MSDSPAAPADAVDEPSWQAATRELDDTIDDLMAAVVRLLKMVKAIPESPCDDAQACAPMVAQSVTKRPRPVAQRSRS
jgi:hypothetical protein